MIDILDEESVEYDNLLKLSIRKTPVIVSENLEELAKITDEEQIIVSRINRLDSRREEAINDIANVLNKDVTNLQIVDLIKMLASRPEEQNKLAAAFDRLKENVLAVKRINEQNKELLESALEFVQFNMNVVQSLKKAPETANYNKGAYNTGTLIGTSYKAFDAKQ